MTRHSTEDTTGTGSPTSTRYQIREQIATVIRNNLQKQEATHGRAYPLSVSWLAEALHQALPEEATPVQEMLTELYTTYQESQTAREALENLPEGADPSLSLEAGQRHLEARRRFLTALSHVEAHLSSSPPGGSPPPPAQAPSLAPNNEDCRKEVIRLSAEVTRLERFEEALRNPEPPARCTRGPCGCRECPYVLRDQLLENTFFRPLQTVEEELASLLSHQRTRGHPSCTSCQNSLQHLHTVLDRILES